MPHLLNQAEIHIFVPAVVSKIENLAMTALEFITFHPGTPLNNKFQVNVVSPFDGLDLLWYHFPKEFRPQCEIALERFNIAILKSPRSYMVGGNILTLPKDDRILITKPNRPMSDREIECAEIEMKSLGNSFERLGLD